MYFLTQDKIFIFDNFSFVQDKKYFVRAEGRGMRQNILSMAKKFISATYKSKKITLPDETVNLCKKQVIFMDLCIAEMNFLAMDKFDFV